MIGLIIDNQIDIVSYILHRYYIMLHKYNYYAMTSVSM